MRSKKNILAFGAHPDDIEIGVGGTLIKFSDFGHSVTGVIATIPPNKKTREKESRNAASIMNIDIELLDIEFSELYFSRKLVKTLDKIIEKYQPDIIFAQWNNDSHQDHNVLTNGIIAATRKNKSSLYMYEQTIPGGIVPHSFNAQMYVDISDVIEKKIESIKAHKSQKLLHGDWWIQGVKGRAMYRGYQINVKYAEAFEVVKHIYDF